MNSGIELPKSCRIFKATTAPWTTAANIIAEPPLLPSLAHHDGNLEGQYGSLLSVLNRG